MLHFEGKNRRGIDFLSVTRESIVCILLANVSKLVPNELTNISKRFTVAGSKFERIVRSYKCYLALNDKNNSHYLNLAVS